MRLNWPARLRLPAFYFFHFGTLGAVLPFFGPWLEARGLNAVQVGMAIGALTLMKIVAPNILGWLGDRKVRRAILVRVAAIAALAAFLPIPALHALVPLLTLIALFGFFWTAALPQVDALTLTHLGNDSRNYSLIRLWGSVGFIVSVVLMGRLQDWVGIAWLPLPVIVMLVGLAIAAQALPDHGATVAQAPSGRAFKLKRPMISLLVASFLLQASHGPYYAFFSLYLEQAGFSGTAIGLLWALGVAAEIGLFMGMPRLLRHYDDRLLLLWALAATVLRWLMLAAGQHSILLLTLSQTLHLASFGMCHAVAVDLIHQWVPAQSQGRAQALYNSLCFGGGVALGGLLSGLVWAHGDHRLIFLGAAAAAAVAWLVIRVGVHRRETTDITDYAPDRVTT